MQWESKLILNFQIRLYYMEEIIRSSKMSDIAYTKVIKAKRKECTLLYELLKDVLNEDMIVAVIIAI